MKIETDYWSAIPVDYDELMKFAEEATDEIEKLQKALTLYERERERFRHNNPEITGAYFLTGGHGERDANQLPQYVRICPAYGANFEIFYKKTDQYITYEGG